MANGTVKWFRKESSQEKKYGYGFIAPDEPDNDSNNDVFVHISAVKDSGLDDLQKDQKVCYDVESRNGKTSAINIKLLDD